jgi:hypothetical protein
MKMPLKFTDALVVVEFDVPRYEHSLQSVFALFSLFWNELKNIGLKVASGSRCSLTVFVIYRRAQAGDLPPVKGPVPGIEAQ